MNTYTTFGTVKYADLNPQRSRHPMRYNIKCLLDNELGALYMTLLKKNIFGFRSLKYYMGDKTLGLDDLGTIKTLHHPPGHAHITVNFKSPPMYEQKQKWGWMNNKKVKITIFPEEIIRDRDYIIVKAMSKDLEELRTALGYSPLPKEGYFHFTFAIPNFTDLQDKRTKENAERKRRENR